MRSGIRTLQIEPEDNVGVVLEAAGSGDALSVVTANGRVGRLVCSDGIPRFHKVALSRIGKGEPVVKYGSYIGEATSDIEPGEYVHIHNCSSDDACRERHRNDGAYPPVSVPLASPPGEGQIQGVAHAPSGASSEGAAARRWFWGYARQGGRVGIRNHVLVLPASVCASDVCRMVSDRVPGTVTLHNQSGCSQVDRDRELTLRTVAGVGANPNVHSVLVIGLGCEGCQARDVAGAIRSISAKEVRTLVIQEAGGMSRAVERGVAIAEELVSAARTCKRERFPVSKLVIGTNCGGSDTTSGLGANPLVGRVSDWLGEVGATSVLCETPELFGAEDALASRAADPSVAEEIIEMVRRYERYVALFGAQMREGNPSPGNIAGGLTTLEEKSLGCVHKGGHGTVNAAIGYADQIPEASGLVVMDTPGNDPTSVMGLVAGGAQAVIFSTGLGTPTGNPVVPVLRLTSNPDTAKAMSECIDFDATEAIFGPRGMGELASDLEGALLDVCDGGEVRAERQGFVEVALPHLCNYM
jgi:altronate dehydratase large subunit